MTKDWKPVDPQILVDAWEEVKDFAEGIQKDLACPDEEVAKILRSVADSFHGVEEVLDKEEVKAVIHPQRNNQNQSNNQTQNKDEW